MAKPNWDKIKAEYVAGGTSYRKLAEKYGLPRRTLEDRAKAEDWASLKGQVRGKVVAELPATVAAVKLTHAEEWVSGQLSLAFQLRHRLMADLDPKAKKQLWMGTMKGPELLELPKLNDVRDVKTLTEAMDKLDVFARRQLGLDEDRGETELDSDWDGALAEVEKRREGDSE